MFNNKNTIKNLIITLYVFLFQIFYYAGFQIMHIYRLTVLVQGKFKPKYHPSQLTFDNYE